MLKQIIAFLVLCLCSMSAMAATLTAEVDRTELSSNESLRLIVAVDEAAQESIDFGDLDLQFDIISTQRGEQRYSINGRVSTTTQWILILSPKETGKLLIPSFEYQGSYSQAISVTVNDGQAYADKAAQRDVYLQVSVNKNSSYVQEQLLVTMRLYYKTALSSYDDETLTIENTTVTLVSETNFRSDVKGVNYQVLEKVYALHPQASGELIIPSQSWRLEKALNRFNFGRSGNPYLYVRSDPVTVDVKPIASDSTADTWLPSNALTLDGQWKQSIIQAKVGEPLNLQLVLIANGLTAAQLPNITLPTSDQFTVYEDQPNANDTESTSGIIGTRVNQYAVIPKEAGSFTFPEVTVKWWNTLKDKEEQARFPAQTIVVVRADQKDSEQLPDLPASNNKTQATHTTGSTLLWKGLTALFALLSLGLAYLLYRAQGKATFVSKEALTKETLNPLIRHGATQSLKRIEQAAAEKNWLELKDAIIDWGNQLPPKKPLHSLHDLGEELPKLQPLLNRLDRHLYSGQAVEDYEADSLVSAIKAIKRGETKGSSAEALKPLYKSF